LSRRGRKVFLNILSETFAFFCVTKLFSTPYQR
jgi:hypothetical protein